MDITPIKQLWQQGQHDAARELANELLKQHPDNAELLYEAASIHDVLDFEAEAMGLYRSALNHGLKEPARRAAVLGLGSTLRALGDYSAAEQVLTAALVQYPDGSEFKVFLAMTLHNLERHRTAVELLLQVVAATSADPHVQTYRHAIELYAQDVTKTWR